jgi:hypothetical protein
MVIRHALNAGRNAGTVQPVDENDDWCFLPLIQQPAVLSSSKSTKNTNALSGCGWGKGNRAMSRVAKNLEDFVSYRQLAKIFCLVAY